MNDNKVKNLVITAFFTAITFLGIQSFRIPLPAAVGTPFLHFGHIFVVMGLLLQGGKRGAVSGTLGLTIFDMLNGYMAGCAEDICGDSSKMSDRRSTFHDA